jgi:hypothetical protein
MDEHIQSWHFQYNIELNGNKYWRKFLSYGESKFKKFYTHSQVKTFRTAIHSLKKFELFFKHEFHQNKCKSCTNTNTIIMSKTLNNE